VESNAFQSEIALKHSHSVVQVSRDW